MRANILIMSSLLVFTACTKKDEFEFPQKGSAASAEGASDGSDVEKKLRRVTKSQFLNTIDTAFGMPFVSEGPMPEDLAKENLISIGSLGAVFSLRDIELYSNASWEFASEYVTSSAFQQTFKSSCEQMDRDSFEQVFPDVAKVLFHGKSVDFEDFGNLFDSVVASLKEEDPTLSQGRLNCDAMKAAITSMVISPNALYYENVVPSSVGKASLVNKKAYSKAVANQLSFLLWDGPPDAALLEVAEKGELWDTEQRIKAVRRMVSNKTRLQKGMQALFGDWLAIRNVEKVASSVNDRAEIAQSAVNEFNFLVDQSINSNDFLDTFMNSRSTQLDATLAGIYGVQQNVSELPQDDRAGFLTRASFLMAGGAGATSPTKRGHFILEHLLCQEVPLPDPNLDLSTGLDENADKYDVIKARIENNNCRACHTLLDPIALGLEGYGVNGEMTAFPDLTTYGLQAMVNQQEYTGGVQLSSALSQDDRVAECFALHVVRIANGEHEDLQAKEKVKNVVAKFRSGQAKTIDELIVALLSNQLIIGSMGE